MISQVCAECARKLAGEGRYIFSTEPLLPIEERLYCVDERLDERTVRLMILVRPATKKNSGQWFPFRHGRGGRLLASKPFLVMQKQAAVYCPDLRIDYPCNVKAIYYMKTRAKCDISNLHSALHDVLVHWHTMEDDNWKIIVSTDGSRVRWDKDNPRIEVEITPAPEEDVRAAREMTPPERPAGKKKKGK